MCWYLELNGATHVYIVAHLYKSLQDSSQNKGNNYSDYLQQNHNIKIS